MRQHGNREGTAGVRARNDARHPGKNAPDARAGGDYPPDRRGAFGCGGAGNHGLGHPGAAPPDSGEDARRERIPGTSRHPSDLEVPPTAPVRVQRQRPRV